MRYAKEHGRLRRLWAAVLSAVLVVCMIPAEGISAASDSTGSSSEGYVLRHTKQATDYTYSSMEYDRTSDGSGAEEAQFQVELDVSEKGGVYCFHDGTIAVYAYSYVRKVFSGYEGSTYVNINSVVFANADGDVIYTLANDDGEPLTNATDSEGGIYRKWVYLDDSITEEMMASVATVTAYVVTNAATAYADISVIANGDADDTAFYEDSDELSAGYDYVNKVNSASEAGTYEWTLDFSTIRRNWWYSAEDIHKGITYYYDEDGNVCISNLTFCFVTLEDGTTATLDRISFCDADGNEVCAIENEDGSALYSEEDSSTVEWYGAGTVVDATAEELESVTSIVATVTTGGSASGRIVTKAEYNEDVVLFNDESLDGSIIINRSSSEGLFYKDIEISKEKFADAGVGDRIIISWYNHIDIFNTGYDYSSSLILTTNGAADSAFADAVYAYGDSASSYYDFNSYKYTLTSITLTEEMLAELQEYGLTLSTDGYEVRFGYFVLEPAESEDSSSEESGSSESSGGDDDSSESSGGDDDSSESSGGDDDSSVPSGGDDDSSESSSGGSGQISQSLSIYYSSSVSAGSTMQITASATGDGGFAYTSSDTSIATVSESGLVTGVSPGTVKITVTALGTSTYREISKTLTITVTEAVKTNLSYCDVSLSSSSYTYDGNAKKPTVTVSEWWSGTVLTKDTDYTVSYQNNTNAGTATVIVTGIGNYEGTATAYFTINKASQTITLSASSVSLTAGATSTPAVSGAKTTLGYTSSDTSVATVNSSGKITAQKVGTATITVTAKATDNYNSASKTISVTVKPAATTISSATNTSDGVKLSWSKVSGATGYYVYRSTSKTGTYTKIATVSGGTTVTYTNKSSGTNKVTSGKTYYYKVYAYASTGTSAASSAKGIRYLTAGKISSLTNTSGGIKLNWSKVTGASGYYVYRKTGSGSYSKIKTITSVSTVTYTDTAVKSKNGTTYTYKVVPYYKSGSTSYTGSFTEKKTVRLTAVSISSVKNSSSKKMTVKWAKNSKATGYQIQYSTSSSFASGNKTVTVSGASSVSKVIGSLTKKKTYYVRIRVYKTVSGTKYYSAWSSKKSVKISK